MWRDSAGGLARLCIAAFVAYGSYALCRTPLLPLLARDLGAGPSMVGVVVAASTITGIVVKLPAGALSDVVGRRPLLMAGTLVFALVPFAYLGVSTLAGLVLLRLLHGNATAIFGPVASASVSDLAPPDRRGAWLGAYATAQGAGQALGPLLAGYLLAAGRFDAAFVAAGIIGLAAPLVVRRVAAVPAPHHTESRGRAFVAGIREVLGDRLVLVTSAAHAAQFVMNGALNAFLPLYGRDVVGLTLPQLGWLFAGQTLTTLAVRPLVGAASDRIGRRGVITAGLTVCAAAVWGVSATTHVWALAGAVMIYAAGVATTTAATSAFITDVTRRARYGAAHGVFGTIYDIGDASGPIAAGLLVGAVGYPSMFRVMAVLGLTAAAAFWALSRHDAR